MKKIYFIPLILLMLFAAGCRQDELRPELPGIDSFEGYCDNFAITDATSNLRSEKLVCHIRTEGGTVITRNAIHQRLDGVSKFTLDVGVKEGDYTLLYFECDSSRKHGLGAKVRAENEEIKVLTEYNSTVGFFGKGTKEDPFNITCEEDLVRLNQIVQSPVASDYLNQDTHFKQIADIMDMSSYSFAYDNLRGWPGIGSLTSPFSSQYDGGGYIVSGLWAEKYDGSGVGLFGYIMGSHISNVRIRNSDLSGITCVGGVVGAVMTSGETRDVSIIEKCSVESTMINYFLDENGAVKTYYGMGAGGIVGSVDEFAMAILDLDTLGKDCKVAGSWSVGGILGASNIHSRSIVQRCHNQGSPIYGGLSSIGGVVGSGDTIFVYACTNKGDVEGQIQKNAELGYWGTGGIIGGSGKSSIVGCVNYGEVKGYLEVGGIIGSAKASEQYNDVFVTTCGNEGDVSGHSYVGGICGQAQLGGYGNYNEGSISSSGDDSYVGGILGGASAAYLQYNVNFGDVSGDSFCGGISSFVNMAAFSVNQNFGDISGNDGKIGGILGLTGSESIIHYCSNYGKVKNNGGDVSIGGIIGEIGDPDEWSGSDVFSVVMGATNMLVGATSFVLAIASPLFSSISVINTISMILSCGLSTFDGICKCIDASSLIHSTVDYFYSEEITRINNELKADLSVTYDEITEHIETLSEERIKEKKFNLPDGISSSALTEHNSYRTGIIDFLNDDEESEKNRELFDYNLRLMIEKRAELNQAETHNRELMHNIISGAVLVTSIVVSISAIVVTIGGSIITAGGGSPILVSVLGGIIAGAGAIVATVGGANSIVKSCNDFTDNCSIVSQCLNMGQIESTSSSPRIGGIVGMLQQRCLVSDCINGGERLDDRNGGGIFGIMNDDSDCINNMNIGSGWYFAMGRLESETYYENFSHNYCLTGISTDGSYCSSISLEELSNEDTYDSWAFDGVSKWRIPSSSLGYFPVPYKSAMQFQQE